MLIDVKAEVVSRLPLQPIEDTVTGGYKYKGLIPAKLVKVEVVKYEHKKGEFMGAEVPELHFEFMNYKTSSTEPDRFYTFAAKIVPSKKYAEDKETLIDKSDVDIEENGTKLPGINTLILETWATIKSILQACSNSKNYKDISDISQADLAKYFNLPGVEVAKVRMEKWEAFFNYIANFVNNAEAPMIPVEGLPMWIKLLPEYQHQNRYVFPRFVGKGIVEPMMIDPKTKEVVAPIKLQLYPGESLVLKSGKGKDVQGAAPTEGNDKMVEDLINNSRPD